MANASATAADITAPLRAAQAARQAALGNGDEEFRRLFSDWQDQDKPALAAAARPAVSTPLGGARQGVSIPSLMPVSGVNLSSGFGMRIHPVLGSRRAHNGVDLAAPTGTPIYAAADGTVSKVEWFSSYGLYVALEHGGEIQTRYGHMSRINVQPGQQVRKGDVIGFVGSTGRSTGPHLHYEVRIAGAPVNPIPYMQSEAVSLALVSGGGGKGGPE
ncbi:MAG TPA: M23 family metallopeptidase [Novosphingobium sp.]|nr:M23 family metallopeptidase [Novosphingobium sp.]